MSARVDRQGENEPKIFDQKSAPLRTRRRLLGRRSVQLNREQAQAVKIIIGEVDGSTYDTIQSRHPRELPAWDDGGQVLLRRLYDDLRRSLR